MKKITATEKKRKEILFPTLRNKKKHIYNTKKKQDNKSGMNIG